ncbi:hypothetical protein BRC68_01565 [Halobacteriales archaeon QH_6_64_20]|nr:MAG: hypothetical protein BRC68_01565 [Halobacteriales archaeon QH_6_64_20]
MRRVALSPLVLACVLLLAGCSGFAGDGAGADGGAGVEPMGGGAGGGSGVNVTPAPVPAVERTESARSVAPGVTATGVSDPDSLLSAHRSALAETAYTVRAVVNATYPNGTTYYRSAATTRVTERRERYYYAGRFARPEGSANALVRYESWSNGRVILTAATRRNNGTAAANATAGGGAADDGATDSATAGRSSATSGNTTYRAIPAEYERNAGIYGPPRYGERIEVPVSVAETAVRDRTDTVGATYYFVSLTSVRDPSALASARFRNVRNASGWFLVSPQGFVRQYRLVFTATTRNENTVRVVESIEYSNVGLTTVERPSWYDEATNRTNATAGATTNTTTETSSNTSAVNDRAVVSRTYPCSVPS